MERKPAPTRGSKPGERRGGRKKGVPNKNTAAIRDMIIGALDKCGGEAYLVTQANENPVAFMGLLGKVMPTQITGEGGASLTVVINKP